MKDLVLDVVKGRAVEKAGEVLREVGGKMDSSFFYYNARCNENYGTGIYLNI